MRDVPIDFPVVDGLDRIAGLFRYGGGAAQRGKDAFDYRHSAHYPINGLTSQPPYPKIFNAPPVPSWQTCAMDSAFDRDVVRARMKEQGVSQQQLASEMGLHQSAVHNILAGTRQVKAHEAAHIYSRLGIDRQPDVQLVPIIGLASAGNWREAILSSEGVMPVPKRVAGKRSFAIEVKGDSMDKLIPDGGFAIVDPDQTQLYNDKVYLIENPEHEAQVKLYRSNPARFEPASTNELHTTLMVGEHAIKVIGRVVWQGAPL